MEGRLILCCEVCVAKTLQILYQGVSDDWCAPEFGTHILDSLQKSQLFRKWDNGMGINPENETAHTTQYQEAFLKYVENKYCAKHKRLPVTESDKTLNNNLSTFEIACRSAQSSHNPYDLCSGSDEYLMRTNVTKTTPGRSDHSTHLLTAARFNLNSPAEVPQNWGQINPNLNHYHSEPMKISSTFWFMDISVSNGSGSPGCGPGLEPERMVQSGLLPGKQGYQPGLGTGWNWTAVPYYCSCNFASS